MRLKLQKHSVLKFVSRIIPQSGGNESQASETKCTEACRTNYPACEAKRGTIPRSGGYNTPQLAAIKFPKLALGFIPVIFLLAASIYLRNSINGFIIFRKQLQNKPFFKFDILIQNLIVIFFPVFFISFNGNINFLSIENKRS